MKHDFHSTSDDAHASGGDPAIDPANGAAPKHDTTPAPPPNPSPAPNARLQKGIDWLFGALMRPKP